MNKQKKIIEISKFKGAIFGLCLLFIWMLLIGYQVDAVDAESEPTKNSFQFTMEARLPENQIDQSKTYFDLRVQPGQVQDIQVDLVNLTQQELTLQIYATTAVTNNNGVIDYTIVDPKRNETLKYPFSEIAQVVNPEVVLAEKEQKTVNIQLTIPEETFSGVILGGIFVTPQEKEGNQKATKQVTTQQSMVKGVCLSENDEAVEPKLEFLQAQAGQIGYRNVFQAILQNPQPIILDNLDIKASVYKKGNMNQAVYENESNGLKMAPNSSFNYAVPLNSALFVPGNYVMKLKAVSGEQEWEFEQPLNVTVVEAEKFNQQIPEELLKLKSNNGKKVWWLWLLGAVFCLVVLGGVGCYLIPSWRQKITHIYLALIEWVHRQYGGRPNQKNSRKIVEKEHKKIKKNKHTR